MGPGSRGQARPPALLELSDEEDQGMASCSRSWSWAVGGLQCCGLQCAVVDCGLWTDDSVDGRAGASKVDIIECI